MYQHVKNFDRKLTEEVLSAVVKTICYNISYAEKAMDITPKEIANIIIFSGEILAGIVMTIDPSIEGDGNFTFNWVEVKEVKEDK